MSSSFRLEGFRAGPGARTAEVLSGPGYSGAEIDELISRGVIDAPGDLKGPA